MGQNPEQTVKLTAYNTLFGAIIAMAPSDFARDYLVMCLAKLDPRDSESESAHA